MGNKQKGKKGSQSQPDLHKLDTDFDDYEKWIQRKKERDRKRFEEASNQDNTAWAKLKKSDAHLSMKPLATPVDRKRRESERIDFNNVVVDRRQTLQNYMHEDFNSGRPSQMKTENYKDPKLVSGKFFEESGLSFVLTQQ